MLVLGASLLVGASPAAAATPTYDIIVNAKAVYGQSPDFSTLVSGVTPLPAGATLSGQATCPTITDNGQPTSIYSTPDGGVYQMQGCASSSSNPLTINGLSGPYNIAYVNGIFNVSPDEMSIVNDALQVCAQPSTDGFQVDSCGGTTSYPLPAEAVLTDDSLDYSGLPDQNIQFSVTDNGGSTYSLCQQTTDSNGDAACPETTSAGNIPYFGDATVTASFAGNLDYLPVSATVPINNPAFDSNPIAAPHNGNVKINTSFSACSGPQIPQSPNGGLIATFSLNEKCPSALYTTLKDVLTGGIPGIVSVAIPAVVKVVQAQSEQSADQAVKDFYNGQFEQGFNNNQVFESAATPTEASTQFTISSSELATVTSVVEDASEAIEVVADLATL